MSNRNSYNPELGGPDVEHNIATFVNQCFKDDDEAKRRLATVWQENIRFFAGDQFIYYNQLAQTMEKIPLPKGMGPKPVSNRYTPSIMQVISDLTRTEPAALVLADSNQPEAVLRAKLAEKLRYQMWEDLDEAVTYIILASWLTLTGTAVKEDVWDSEVQDVASCVLSPFNVGFPPYANELFNEFNSPWIGKWTLQTVEWVKEMYEQDGEGFLPHNVAGIRPEALGGSLRMYNELRQSVPRLGSLLGTTGTKGDFVVLKELYLRPNKHFPQGRYYVVVGDRPVYVSDSPYFVRVGQRTVWNSMTLFRYMIVPGRFWGMCPADDLVPLQRKINAIDTAIGVVRRKMGAPQWMVPNQCNVAQNLISGDAGQVIRYDAKLGLKPEKIDAVGVPASFWVERDKAEQEMALISGDVDVLRAHQPRGARGVQALQLMTEIVSSRRAPVVKFWEKGIAKSERMKLLIYRMFAQQENTERLAAYVDEFGEGFVQAFFGEAVPFNIRIEAGSTLPKLQASQQQQLLAAFKMGLVGDPQDPLVRKEVASRLGIIDMHTSWEVDTRKAELENSAILRGDFDAVDFTPFDNHALELAIHVNAIKQPGFKTINPEFGEFMVAHIMQHYQFMAQMMMTQQGPGEPRPKANPDEGGME